MGLAEAVMYEARFGRRCSSHLVLGVRLDDADTCCNRDHQIVGEVCALCGFLSEDLMRPFFFLFFECTVFGLDGDKGGSLGLGLCCCVLIWPLMTLSPGFAIPVARN